MPSFVRALSKATSNYMKELSGSISKKIARKTISIAKSMSNDLVKGMRYQGPTISDFNSSDGGGVFLLSKRFSQRLKNTLEQTNAKFMQEVFALSQEYVPIDKRYARAYLSRGITKKILELGEDEISYFTGSRNEDSFIGFSDRFQGGINETRKRLKYEEGLSFVTFSRKKGWYDADEISFIKQMFRGSNRTTALNRVFADPYTGTLRLRKKRTDLSFDTNIKLRKNPYDNKGSTKNSKVQPTGGFQELKKSGKLITFDDGMQISYNGYDRSRPFNTFNYAALQHDNLRFKHDYGTSMFLHKAFLKRRRDWYRNIEKSLQNAIQNK